MATITIADQTFARLQAAAATRKVSIAKYLDDLVSSEVVTQTVSARAAAAGGIRQLSTEITSKVPIDELIDQKHADHKR